MAATGEHLRLLSRFSIYRHFISSDYKNLDKTIPAWLIWIDILFINLDLTLYQDRGVPDTNALIKAWKYLIDYFIRTPIRLCNGERYRKGSGVASGRYFTQIIDSIVNWIVTNYVIRKCGRKVLDICVLGDDSFVAIDDKLDMEAFAFFAAKCGMLINHSAVSESTRERLPR